jgi:hypothetical protein
MAPSPLLALLLAACAVRIAQPTPVTDWQARVQVAGGDVATGTLQAHAAFYAALQSANLLGKIARLNTFSGTTLDSALVPLIRGAGCAAEQKSTTAIPNAVSGASPAFAATYAETTGISQTAGFLVTGRTISRLNLSDSTSALGTGQNVHMSVFVLGAMPTAGRIMGVFRGDYYTRHYLKSDSTQYSWETRRPRCRPASGAATGSTSLAGR